MADLPVIGQRTPGGTLYIYFCLKSRTDRWPPEVKSAPGLWKSVHSANPRPYKKVAHAGLTF
jgi:hypothetical protein